MRVHSNAGHPRPLTSDEIRDLPNWYTGYKLLNVPLEIKEILLDGLTEALAIDLVSPYAKAENALPAGEDRNDPNRMKKCFYEIGMVTDTPNNHGLYVSQTLNNATACNNGEPVVAKIRYLASPYSKNTASSIFIEEIIEAPAWLEPYLIHEKPKTVEELKAPEWVDITEKCQPHPKFDYDSHSRMLVELWYEGENSELGIFWPEGFRMASKFEGSYRIVLDETLTPINEYAGCHWIRVERRNNELISG